jgi:hypothetical protein
MDPDTHTLPGTNTMQSSIPPSGVKVTRQGPLYAIQAVAASNNHVVIYVCIHDRENLEIFNARLNTRQGSQDTPNCPSLEDVLSLLLAIPNLQQGDIPQFQIFAVNGDRYQLSTIKIKLGSFSSPERKLLDNNVAVSDPMASTRDAVPYDRDLSDV